MYKRGLRCISTLHPKAIHMNELNFINMHNSAYDITQAMQATFKWSQRGRGQSANMASMSDKDWLNRLYTETFPGANVKALHTAFYKPELLLRYMSMFQHMKQVVTVMRAWVAAVTEDVQKCVKGQESSSALFRLRAGQTYVSKKNKRHLDALVAVGANVEAWLSANELEHDPETLFHLGEAVASCQSITSPIARTYAKALTSYFAVGHIGALVAADGPACEPLARGAKRCENMVMRAIIRLLIGKNFQPKSPFLLLEKPYKVGLVASDSPRIKQAAWHLLSNAFSLCHKVKAHLVIANDARLEWDEYLRGMQISVMNKWGLKLKSVDGFSPYTYSDSANTHETSLSTTHAYDNAWVFRYSDCKANAATVKKFASMHAV